MRKTKIVCTLGPATKDEETIRELMLSGMNVARLNFSHGCGADQQPFVDMVKKVRKELDLPVALLLDTKGPEIRIGTFEKSSVTLKTGDRFTLTTRDVPGNEQCVSQTFERLPQEVKPGTMILIDDGLIGLKVETCTNTDVVCTVKNGGTISSRKGVNVPGAHLSLPFISEKDRQDLAFGVEQGFDFIAASFTRTAQDITDMRSELQALGCHNIKIIAKIENADGVQNIEDIIRVADGIMIARGDMGVEIPIEEIPIIQKDLIKKASNEGLQVITATQMLDSMIKNPRPTRAEATDVANAIYDGTSAIMLSGETAAGLYPVLAVKTMAKIAERTENDINYIERFKKRHFDKQPNVTSAISHATCTTAYDLGAVAIITVTKTGRTARMISKYRPSHPIISGTTDPTVMRQMSLSWGVIPILVDEKNNTDALFGHVINTARNRGLVQDGDLVVITAGVPLGVSGTTNLLKVQLVGDVLVSGQGVSKGTVCGNLCVCSNAKEANQDFKDGDILVIPETSNEILPFLKSASAIITEQGGKNSHAAVVGLTLGKPVIVSAQNATQILKSGTTVTVDASRGIVFSGLKCEKSK
ncbi:MAG: pyruvate kinase [Oscillospiraceae bacterium]|jgi:pyruvate kinase|nr:pyruvate kinase [Oscillospiraceae bacterium]